MTTAVVQSGIGTCLVSFQGTSNIGSALKDLQITKAVTKWAECDGCRVHSGFLDEYNGVRQCVQTALTDKGCPPGSPIRTTGHSLGASMNSLAMMDLTDAGWDIEESYDFGKPRTGDSNFAATHKRLFHLDDHLDYMGLQTSIFGCNNGFEASQESEHREVLA